MTRYSRRGATVGPAHVGLLDLTDEGDVFTLRRIVVLPERCCPGCTCGVVPQQVVDRADAERAAAALLPRTSRGGRSAWPRLLDPISRRRRGDRCGNCRTRHRGGRRWTWAASRSASVSASAPAPAPMRTVTSSPPELSSRSIRRTADAASCATTTTSSPGWPGRRRAQGPAQVSARSLAMRTEPWRTRCGARHG